MGAPLRTPEQARAWVLANGINLAELARKHGISRFAIYNVLEGKCRGRRGQSHVAAVVLGIKADPKTVRV